MIIKNPVLYQIVRIDTNMITAHPQMKLVAVAVVVVVVKGKKFLKS